MMAGDHDRESVVGTVGDAVFEAPYLKAPLVVWDAEGIGVIESGAQRELSCGYFYRADMTPGVIDGERYDGRMVDIAGNHVALVSTGRAGPDVLVGDNLPKEIPMAVLSRKAALVKGALTEFLRPRLAQDAQIDLSAVVRGVTASTYVAQKPKIAEAVTKATEGKLAADASLDDLGAVLARFDRLAADEADEEEKDVPEGADEDDEDEDKPKGEDEEDGPAMKPDMKAAMDAAIAANVTKAVAETRASTIAHMNAIREAERAVRPYVGEIVVAMDSAEAVYRFALDKVGVDHKGLHPTALRPVLEAQPVPGSVKPKTTMAQDAAGAKAFLDRFPDAARIRHA
jgi:hypothetical protein